MNRELKFIAKAVSIRKRITWHVSRHTFATQYLNNGDKIERLKEVMDHSSPATTIIYSHIANREIAKDMHLFDKYNINKTGSKAQE